MKVSNGFQKAIHVGSVSFKKDARSNFESAFSNTMHSKRLEFHSRRTMEVNRSSLKLNIDTNESNLF